MLSGQAKKDWQRVYMRDYRKTHKKTVRPELKTVRPIVRPDDESVRPSKTQLIKDLQANIDNIQPQEQEVKHRCLQCQALGKYTQAIEEADIYTEQGVKRAWLCGKCLTKVEVSAGF